MSRVLHNTLGCHPLLHTEAHEITHLYQRATPVKIVDEHEASRRLGLTFPVLVRHPDKHPVFQSDPRARVTIALYNTSSRHRRYQVCRRFASWTSDRPALRLVGLACAIRAAASAGCAQHLY